MIKRESIDSLVESVNIIDVVSSYIDLKKAGTTHKTRCPFHEEKTPSFAVSFQKQIFHCFGCGVGGNSIRFIQNIENISFPEAVENLAERYGFQLEYDKNHINFQEKLPILQTINKWFEENLKKKKTAFDYLISRGLTKDTIQKFQLGYSPSSYELLRFLQSKNISFKEAEDLGVIALNEDGRNYYSRFTERVMFPIFSQNGKITAFGGRTLSDHPAKYINSPTTPYFNKSKTLYGYNFAKREIYQTGKVHIVEGYLDVIMLHQAGINNVVAPLGTAFTKDHIHIIKKGDISINLAFDGDKAGLEATKRALDVLMPIGIESSVTVFENGVDPADLIKEGNIEKVKNILENAEDSIKFYLQRVVSKYDLKNPYEKNRAFADGKITLAKLPKVIGGEYSNYLLEILSIQTPELLMKKGKVRTGENIHMKKEFFGLSELSIIRSIIDNPDMLDIVLAEIDQTDFSYYKDLFQHILNKDFENQDLRKISMMDCTSFSKDELQIELINHKIMRSKKELNNLMQNREILFRDKAFKVRTIRNSLISLKKRRTLLHKYKD